MIIEQMEVIDKLQNTKSKQEINEISQKVLQAAKDTLGERLEMVILYGSYARGDYDKDSDVDFLVLANVPQEDAGRWRDSIYECLPDLSLDYDILLSVKVTGSMTFNRYANILPYYMNVIREGVVLYGEQRFT